MIFSTKNYSFFIINTSSSNPRTPLFIGNVTIVIQYCTYLSTSKWNSLLFLKCKQSATTMYLCSSPSRRWTHLFHHTTITKSLSRNCSSTQDQVHYEWSFKSNIRIRWRILTDVYRQLPRPTWVSTRPKMSSFHRCLVLYAVMQRWPLVEKKIPQLLLAKTFFLHACWVG